MKYCKLLRAAEREAPRAYEGAWLNYKSLKKHINIAIKSGEYGRHDDAFFELLRAQLAVVNSCFEREASSVRSHMRRLKKTRWLMSCMASSQAQALLGRAHWALKYALLNAAGVKKILKKYDKKRGGKGGLGRSFLQDCWQVNNMQLGAVLHSPLLGELRAIEHSLQLQYGGRMSAGSTGGGGVVRGPLGGSLDWDAHWHHSYEDPAETCTRQQHADDPPTPDGSPSTTPNESDRTMSPPLCSTRKGCGDGGAHRGCNASAASPKHTAASCSAGRPSPSSAAAPPAKQGADTVPSSSTPGFQPDLLQLTCSVCLSPLYKPVGLTCGHSFCEPCLLTMIGMQQWATGLVGLGKMLPRDARCPECRQAGVFEGAVMLKELGALSKRMFRDDWRQRKKEDEARRREVNRNLDALSSATFLC